MDVISLNPQQWQAFKRIRIHALKSEPSLLYGDWQDMERQPDTYWIQILTDPNSQIFALMNESKMVGMTAVQSYWEDDTGTVGYLCWNYVLPNFRGTGGGKLLNNARMYWAKHVRKYESLVVMCRDTNERSKAIYKKSGFEPFNSFETNYPDGTVATEIVFKMDLADYECEEP